MTAAPRPGLWARARGGVADQLGRGISPHQLAMTLAVASALALFPMPGTTTLLCLGAGALLGLNQALMQLVNYLLSGLQLLLLLPLWKAGARIGAPPLSLSLDELRARFDVAPWHSLLEFGGVLLGGIGVWALCAPLWIALIYIVARPLMHAAAARRPAKAESRKAA